MLHQTIHADLITAMKSGETLKRDALRFLESDLKKRAIDSRKEIFTDEEVCKIIASHIKSRKESVAQFRAGGEDLVAPELEAITFLEGYLPKQISDQELETLVREILDQVGAVQDVGRAMGAVMPRIAGRADGNRVREMVAKILNV